MSEDDLTRQMGQGPIPPDQMEAEVRVMRHVMRGVNANQKNLVDLAHSALREAAVAKELASHADKTATLALTEAREMSHDLYGYPDRNGDKGVLGEIRSSLGRQSAQNWAILLAILALCGTLVAAAFLHG